MRAIRWLMHCVVVLIVVAGVPAYSQIPQWAHSHQHVRYPASEFILGVGSGIGEQADETAKRLAQSDIASQVRIKLQPKIKNVQQTYELDPNQAMYADFKISSSSVVDEDLTGVEIVETAVDLSTKTTYALAALNKEKLSEAIAAQVMGSWDQVKKFRDAAKEFLREGRLSEAMQDFVEARAAAIDLLPKQALHDAIAPTPLLSERSFGPSALTSDIRRALSSVRIEKIGGDGQKGKIGEKFPEPFAVRVTANEEENVVPIIGASVVFLNSFGEQFGEAITNAKGIAACSIPARESIGRHLRGRLSLNFAGREFSSSLDSSLVMFECMLLDADVAFSVKVDTRFSRVNDLLRSIVVDAVTHLGYHIVDMSRFMLEVEIQTSPPTIDDGVDSTLYTVSSDFTIVLIDKESNKILGSMVAKSKGVAKTHDSALEKSAGTIKFEESELQSLLEKAKN